MSSTPFMQMYWSDYFGATGHLTCEQNGAYLLLIGRMWIAGGYLPNDPAKLARMCGCTASRWAKIAAEVMEFFEVEGDKITHSRVRFELEKAREKSIKRAEAGTRGGNAKALKNNNVDVAIAIDLPCHLPEPEPEDIGKPISIVRPKSKIDETEFDEFWEAYPRSEGKAAARKAYAKARAKISHADLMENLRRLLPSMAEDPKFAPHAATWLNGERWEDQPTKRRAPSPRQPIPFRQQGSNLSAFEIPKQTPEQIAERRRRDAEWREQQRRLQSQ